MNVEKMTNYGKGIVESLSSREYKIIEKHMNVLMVSAFWKEFGLIGLIQIFYRLRNETKKLKEHDWYKLESKNVPREAIEMTFQPIVLMKVLADMAGMDKAKAIITEVFEKTEEKLSKKNFIVNMFLIPVKELKACKDRFVSFKDFTKATETAAIQERFHEAEFVEDTNDTFGFDVKYCAAHAVAKEYGNPAWCFPWCELDDVVYPKVGAELGFRYKRTGSLATGASKCDFRYERI